MTFDSRYTPDLELRRAINHPLEKFTVVGFLGRDTVYGHSAVILKSETLPREEVGGVDSFGIYERAAREMRENERALYVLGDDTVLATSPSSVSGLTAEIFDTYYGEVLLQAIPVDVFEKYDRDEVQTSPP